MIKIEGINDVVALSASVVRFLMERTGRLARFRGRVSKEELVHEGIVGMWMASLEKSFDPELSSILRYWRSAEKAINQYIRDQFGRTKKGLEREVSKEVLPDMPVDPAEKQLIGGVVLELAKGILLANPDAEQGRKDWQVLSLSLKEYSHTDIAELCPWLRDTNSVQKALHRIIMDLRKVMGGDMTKSIIMAPGRKRSSTPASGFDSRKYNKAWYERNRERVKQKSREKMRAKRAALKVAREALKLEDSTAAPWPNCNPRQEDGVLLSQSPKGVFQCPNVHGVSENSRAHRSTSKPRAGFARTA